MPDSGLWWVWPFSWHRRIRTLELHNAALKERVEFLDARLRAAAIQQASLTAAYTAAVAAISASTLASMRSG